MCLKKLLGRGRVSVRKHQWLIMTSATKFDDEDAELDYLETLPHSYDKVVDRVKYPTLNVLGDHDVEVKFELQYSSIKVN